LRILIADDNGMIRRGVARVLSTEVSWDVCGEAKDGAEALLKAKQLTPDLILLDISMPGINGLEVARRLRRDSYPAKILILSQNDAGPLMPSAIAAGADGCVDKSRMGTDLLAAIKNIESAPAGDWTAG
jgi:DNA-binding NarL/FixJ family response regulator